MVAASIARTRFKSEPKQPDFCEFWAGIPAKWVAEIASGGVEDKTVGKTGASKKWSQFSQVCACGGLDLPQFGQFISTPIFLPDDHAHPR
jgi:hypothetical protein